MNLLVLSLLAVVGCSVQGSTTQPSTHPSPNPQRWESDIRAFEKQDQQTPPPAQPILFVGSSTIRFWKTSEAFPGLPVINRGFGGSETSDALFYFDRIVLHYHPKTIVFYEGDNDLADWKSVAQVTDDISQFISRVRKELPDTKLIVIGIKPSIARWMLIDQFRQVNREIRKVVEQKKEDVFIDIEPQVLGANGKPRSELFRLDGLHFNDKGYEILNAAVKPYLEK
ncbi:MAG TPA: SGNH/GDSL hydrolase family protein [Tepidisphaeraceae bacterium]|nr:SGNH/GDSL hydrolase family protein [Tepidisphaeraceae bacterium]